MLEAELKAEVIAAGFVNFAIPWRADVFSGAPQAGSAADYGTLGINVAARKARSEAEWAVALSELQCKPERQDVAEKKGAASQSSPK